MTTILKGHVSPETAYLVNDYPYGFRLRCKIRYWHQNFEFTLDALRSAFPELEIRKKQIATTEDEANEMMDNGRNTGGK